jgi:hypothetical protein
MQALVLDVIHGLSRLWNPGITLGGDWFDCYLRVVELTDSEKTQHSNEWRTYRERNANLLKYRG